jgi:hypothetical protein
LVRVWINWEINDDDFVLQNFLIRSLLNRLLMFGTKKGEELFLLCCVYGRFLSINKASTARPTMITTNRPAIAGTKYMSATDVGVAVGAAVAAGAASTTKALWANDA